MKPELEFSSVAGCGCKPGKLLVDEHTKPMYTEDAFEAAEQFREYYRSGKLYWAVHLRGRHLVNVSIDGKWVVHHLTHNL